MVGKSPQWKSRLLWSRHVEDCFIHHITKPADNRRQRRGAESRVTLIQFISLFKWQIVYRLFYSFYCTTEEVASSWWRCISDPFGPDGEKQKKKFYSNWSHVWDLTSGQLTKERKKEMNLKMNQQQCCLLIWTNHSNFNYNYHYCKYNYCNAHYNMERQQETSIL